MMNSLDYSRLLDRQKDSDSVELDKLVVRIEADLRKHFALTSQTGTVRRNLKCLLLNLYSHWKIDPKLYTGISFDNAAYKVKSRYNVLGVSNRIIDVTKAMSDAGYIEFHPGFHNHEAPDKSRTSRIRATKKLTKLFDDAFSEEICISRPEEEEIIILRGHDPETDNKPEIEYSDDGVPDYVRVMRTNLKRINSALESHWIGIDLTSAEAKEAYDKALADNRVPDFTRKKLARIFNNASWDQGGRFYRAWWVYAPKALRRHILIEHDGKRVPTVEIDYTAVHIDLLYAMEGVNYHREVKTDPYEIKGKEEDSALRNFCKLALNISLNAANKDKAVKAIRKKLIKLHELRDRVSELGGIEAVIDKFAESHKPIRHHFYSGIGNNLQFQDSQIAERIMLGALQAGFIVLPVHDSFLCPWIKAGELYKLMIQAYQEHLKSAVYSKPSKYKPFPKVKRVESKYDIILEDTIRHSEMVNIETERYETWMQELAIHAGDEWDDAGEDYEYDS